MKLIVGLGNPGKEYENTRHNIGFMALDEFASKYNIEINKNKFSGLYGELILNNERLILLKPQNYINLSGDVLNNYVKYFKIDINDILIICDDMDLDVGKYKLKYKGGSAGHNGLKNIEANLKTQEYKRIKIGISKNKNFSSVQHVLGKISKEEKEKIDLVIKTIPDILYDFTILTFDNLMNKYNK